MQNSASGLPIGVENMRGLRLPSLGGAIQNLMGGGLNQYIGGDGGGLTYFTL